MMKSQNMVMKLMSPSPATMLMTVSFKLNFPNKEFQLLNSDEIRTIHELLKILGKTLSNISVKIDFKSVNLLDPGR